jgi:hypothetical protein
MGRARKGTDIGGTKRKAKPRSRKNQGTLSRRQEDALVRAFGAINRFKKGRSKTLSAAASAEHTTVKTIKQLLPAALVQDRPGGPIRVRAADPYSARVEIITNDGPLVVTARGSRERELAGRHRVTVIRVLRNEEPSSALHQFRGKSVGGHSLATDINVLLEPAHGGVLEQLDSLYVGPDAST